jgi:hypothetical protein
MRGVAFPRDHEWRSEKRFFLKERLIRISKPFFVINA